ncbi:alpha/beta fold hydrolase [Arthrobacter sp. CAN_C5]|uniref:alpha/beta fold hydrolase n=1 Tax=Arthrobacter sp. CAN_C5 TaxID=2760706 RepID=UPI001AE34FAD|nr:alpha/beta fold hydrolase [Arthrobacter sp. CAN_C5]MBP2216336.1 pimeloyl-ACP methyl ester carboxylesterase [Arthrobacter sp. CAN_C5]
MSQEQLVTSPSPSDPAEPSRRSGILTKPWIRLAVAVAVTVGYGAVAGWLTPRGPLTEVEAVATVAISLLVGAASGVLLRSRWAVLLAPVLFLVSFELVRAGAEGPTVDEIQLTSLYGIIAFITGRGFHGLLILIPMMFGAVLGAALERRWDQRKGQDSSVSTSRRVRTVLLRGLTALTGVFVLLLGFLVALPGTTDAILADDGTPLPGSVAEFASVDVEDHQLNLMIRGRSDTNPVLLFLAGGPGGTELGAMRNHGTALEEDFVVATLDQRGTGKSMDQFEPASTLTLENAISDALAVTEYLRQRFGQDRIYLVGQSWGSTLGVLLSDREPQLYQAFVGIGQMVSQRATDIIFYEDALEWARSTGDVGLEATLEANGPPPYTDIRAYEPAIGTEQLVHPYDHTPNAEGSGQNSEGLFVEEYSNVEKIRNLGATLDVFSVLYPQLQEIDFREQVTSLDIPVYLAHGRYEAPGRADLALEWYGMLSAPSKELRMFETSGHRAIWEQPTEFHRLMVEVLEDTSG